MFNINDITESIVNTALDAGIRERNRLDMFERYIHTNNCSDEGGWFAFFVPPNSDINSSFEGSEAIGLYVNGCESEEEAVSELIQLAVSKAALWYETEPVG
jgi:hypothetical protein